MKNTEVEIFKYVQFISEGNRYLWYTLTLSCEHIYQVFEHIGGEPSYVWKNEVFKEMYDQACGYDNPSVSGEQILVNLIKLNFSI